SEEAKREFEEVNALYPFVFSRAFLELRQERGRPAAAEAEPGAPSREEREAEGVYPLDTALREQVLECARVAGGLSQDIEELTAQGRADDILLQTVRKRLDRARENLHTKDSAEFAARRLEVTRNSLVTTWRQVRAILLRG